MNYKPEKIEINIGKISWNLSIVESLTKILLENTNDPREFNNCDQANLLALLDEKIKETKNRLEEISLILGI